MANIETMLRYHRDASTTNDSDSLFEGMSEMQEISLSKAEPADLGTRLGWEKELLGLYVSGHPLDRYKDKLEVALAKSNAPKNINELRATVLPGLTTVTAGIISEMRTILTKGGDQMAFIKLADMSGNIEAVVFPKDFIKFKDILHADACVAIKGRVSNRNGELSLVTEALKAL